MKLKQLIILCIVSVGITSCNEKNELLQNTPKPVVSEEASLENNELSESIDGFKLSDYEKELFDNYAKSLDIKVFKDVNPISIAKVYIQCGLTGNWEAEYNLYSKEGFLQSKEEFYELHVKEVELFDLNDRRELADLSFSNLDSAEYVDLDDNKSLIWFYDSYGDKISFTFIENSDGIKLVSQDPIDIYE